MAPRTRWATTIDGASIAYQVMGEGEPPLVVIHGWLSHLEVYWEEPRFARFMRRLARDHRVLQFDKRGTGMSDRFAQAPNLETHMDDVRAVMDAASIEQAALLGWGTGGSALALFFAATYPHRTAAVCTDGEILMKKVPGYQWGWDHDEFERVLSDLAAAWGDEDDTQRFIQVGWGDTSEDGPVFDPAFRRWAAKFARCSATPTSYADFERRWYETDVREVLASVQSPTAVLYKERAAGLGGRENAEYLAERIPAALLIPVPGSAVVAWVEDPEPFVTAVEGFLSSVREQQEEFNRVLATVLFTDIVGSTDRARELGDAAWKALLERHHATIRALIARYRGTELDTAGDAFYSSFDGPARAVRCAHAIVQAMPRLGLHVRTGVHTGEVELIDGKPGGMAVTIGARIAAKASADEVLVSQTVTDLVVGSGLTFQERGAHDLKGVPGQWQLYAAAP